MDPLNHICVGPCARFMYRADHQNALHLQSQWFEGRGTPIFICLFILWLFFGLISRFNVFLFMMSVCDQWFHTNSDEFSVKGQNMIDRTGKKRVVQQKTTLLVTQLILFSCRTDAQLLSELQPPDGNSCTTCSFHGLLPSSQYFT